MTEYRGTGGHTNKMNVIVGICLMALGIMLYVWTSLIIFPGIFSLIGIVSVIAGFLEKDEGN